MENVETGFDSEAFDQSKTFAMADSRNSYQTTKPSDENTVTVGVAVKGC